MSLCSIRERTRRAAAQRNQRLRAGWTAESFEAGRRASTDPWAGADEWAIRAEMERRLVLRGWIVPPQERQVG